MQIKGTLVVGDEFPSKIHGDEVTVRLGPVKYEDLDEDMNVLVKMGLFRDITGILKPIPYNFTFPIVAILLDDEPQKQKIDWEKLKVIESDGLTQSFNMIVDIVSDLAAKFEKIQREK